jgi:hypothetical protein
VCRQARPLTLCVRSLGPDRTRRKAGFDACKVGVEVFEAELQLIVIEPLRASAELTMLELLNDQPEPFDLRLGLGESGALGR